MTATLTIFVLAAAFTVVLALSQWVYLTIVERREREERELARRLGMMGAEEGGLDNLFRERARDVAATALGRFGAHLQQSLERANSPMNVSSLLLRSVLAGLVVGIVLLFFFGITGLLVVPFVAAIPYFLIRRAGTKRMRKLLEQLPDALDLMARSLQAGLGLAEAFRMCAEEMPLPLAQEFGRVFEENRLGRDYRESLNNLSDRNADLFDIRLFSSSVLLQRETGGNLIEILDNIASTIRNRFLFDAKVKALTSEARFSAWILGGLPMVVTLILMVINPTYLSPLIYDPIGRTLLACCFLSYAIGIYLMISVSNVEV